MRSFCQLDCLSHVNLLQAYELDPIIPVCVCVCVCVYIYMDTEAQKGKVIYRRSQSLEAIGQANLTLSNTVLSTMLRVARCVSG